MTMALVGSLVLMALYLGKRWHDASVEIGALRVTIASLKRQLARRER